MTPFGRVAANAGGVRAPSGLLAFMAMTCSLSARSFIGGEQVGRVRKETGRGKMRGR